MSKGLGDDNQKKEKIKEWSKIRVRKSKDNLQKHEYERKQTVSWHRLKIRDEDGWDEKMRSMYYDMNNNFTTSILKNDMTDIEKRPIGEDGKPITKSDVKGEKNYAPGIWSDKVMDKVLLRSDEFARFVIKNDKEKEKNGFYKKNPKIKRVKRISDINQHHINEYVQWKLDSGVSAGSVRQYTGELMKVFESTSKDGVRSHKTLFNKSGEGGSVLKVIDDHIVANGGKEKQYRNKDTATRGVGKTDKEKGYSLENARKIIEKTQDNPMIHLAVNLFTYVGSRIGSLKDMTWGDVIDKYGDVRGEMNFMHNGQMKGNRKQAAEVNESRETLKKIYEIGGFTRSDSIFGDISEYKLKKPIKQACEDLGIDYKGFHAFRSATVEYYETEKIPKMQTGLSHREKKEEMAKALLNLANAEVTDDKGNVIKLHNPMVKKTRKVKVHKRDEHGDVMRDVKGNPIMVTKMKKVKHGKDSKWIPAEEVVMDKNGQPIMERKYNMEKLMTEQLRTLQAWYLSQQISHNRADANTPYRNYKNRSNLNAKWNDF